VNLHKENKKINQRNRRRGEKQKDERYGSKLCCSIIQ